MVRVIMRIGSCVSWVRVRVRGRVRVTVTVTVTVRGGGYFLRFTLHFL